MASDQDLTDGNLLELVEKERKTFNEYFPLHRQNLDAVRKCSAVCAILVRKDGGAGAVTGGTFDNVVTGPEQGTGYVIIVLKSGKSSMFYGTPSVRYFSLRR